jgi:hypothetical protein
MKTSLRTLAATALLGGATTLTPADARAGTVESAHKAADVGFVMVVAGPPTIAVGLVTVAAGLASSWGSGGSRGAAAGLGGITLMGAGAAGILVGPPLLAGGATAGAKRAAAEGVAITPTLGHWSWGLWAGSLTSGLVAQSISENVKPRYSGDINAGGSLVFLGCYVGSIVTGRMQRNQTEAARGLARVPAERRRLQVSLVPARDGLALAGTF